MPSCIVCSSHLTASYVSTANAGSSAGSRYLFGLAQVGQAPRIFLKCTKRGLPWICVLVTWAFSFLTYLSVSNGSTTVSADQDDTIRLPSRTDRIMCDRSSTGSSTSQPLPTSSLGLASALRQFVGRRLSKHKASSVTTCLSRV